MPDSILGFQYDKQTITPLFAKWRVFGDRKLDTLDYWQLEIEPGKVKFLLQSDEELAALQREQVTLTDPENVELTQAQKDFLIAQKVKTQKETEAALACFSEVKISDVVTTAFQAFVLDQLNAIRLQIGMKKITEAEMKEAMKVKLEQKNEKS